MLEFNFDPFPVLETERLILRRMVKSDAPVFFQMRSSRAVMKYIDRPLHEAIAETEIFIESIDKMIAANNDINWGIALKENDLLIGTIGFYRNQLSNHRGEVGYMLEQKYWRKGYMNEALSRTVDFGFSVLNFHTIEACINPDNEASRSILLKNGFEKEAYFKENFFYDGKFSDTEVYSLISPIK